MDNRKLAGLFFGLGFLVIVAGIFTTTRGMRNNKSSQVQPQIINRNVTGVTPKAINENLSGAGNNMQFNNEKCQKVITDLSKVSGVEKVDAVAAGNSILVSCTVSDALRNQPNFKTTLADKVKSIEPSLTNVYIMESKDGMNANFSQISDQLRSGNMTNAKQSWDSFWQQIASQSKR
jgi:hypothetical protein